MSCASTYWLVYQFDCVCGPHIRWQASLPVPIPRPWHNTNCTVLLHCVEAWGFFPTKASLYTKKLKETVHCESDDCIELVAKQLVKTLLWEMSIIMVWHMSSLKWYMHKWLWKTTRSHSGQWITMLHILINNIIIHYKLYALYTWYICTAYSLSLWF